MAVVAVAVIPGPGATPAVAGPAAPDERAAEPRESGPVPMPLVEPRGPEPVPMPLVEPRGPEPVPIPLVEPSGPDRVVLPGELSRRRR